MRLSLGLLLAGFLNAATLSAMAQEAVLRGTIKDETTEEPSQCNVAIIDARVTWWWKTTRSSPISSAQVNSLNAHLYLPCLEFVAHGVALMGMSKRRAVSSLVSGNHPLSTCRLRATFNGFQYIMTVAPSVRLPFESGTLFALHTIGQMCQNVVHAQEIRKRSLCCEGAGFASWQKPLRIAFQQVKVNEDERIGMADKELAKQGGINIHDVGGSVGIKVGGDFVGRDKVTTTTTITTIHRGFMGEEQKQQFQQQIEELREALRDLKVRIEANPSIRQDQKEEAASEVLHHVTALREVKEKTADVPAGKQAPAEIVETVEKALESAGGIVKKLQNWATKAAGLTSTIGEFAAKCGPLIASARHLFGLT